MSLPHTLATAEVNTAALSRNFSVLQAELARLKRTPTTLIAVVKANAYGHGFSLAVPAFLQAGCSFFAVANLDEALAVRKLAPTARILILGYTPPQHAGTLAKNHIEQAVFSLAYAKALEKEVARAGCRLVIHIKIDGGMCRLGFPSTSLRQILAVTALPHLAPVGLFTHFPSADSDKAATHTALSRYLACRDALKKKGHAFFCHTAASAAALTLPDTLLDGVRVGLALYGIPPVGTALPLSPALRLVAPIVQTHRVPRGTHVGYGGEFVTARPSRIGTCPIGYADGIARAFSGGTVTVFHKQMPYEVRVVGRICMDQLMLDLTGTPAKVGDRVLLFDDPRPMANALHTIPYEILTSIGARVARREINKKEGFA